MHGDGTLLLNPPKGAQKRKITVFRLKLHFSQRKSTTKFLLYVKTASGNVVKAFVGYLSVQNGSWCMDVPSTWNFGRNWPIMHPVQKRRFPIDIHS